MTSKPRDEAELLEAYLDGVAELSPEERKRVEARLADDPALRAEADASSALIAKLRELPGEGAEPDWQAMARAIRDEVGPEVPSPGLRRWWAGWRWLAPLAALGLSGAVLALVLRGTPAKPTERAAPVATAPSAPAAPPAADDEDPDTTALWLDGTAVEVDDAALDELLGPDDDDEPGAAELLPADDFAWIDDLGDEELASAEAWLARKKS